MQKPVICEPLRTAIGTFGGTLKDFPAPTLGSTVVKEVLSRTDIDPKVVDDRLL
jgi:acetyl-CoA C-acetyltransferase